MYINKQQFVTTDTAGFVHTNRITIYLSVWFGINNNNINANNFMTTSLNSDFNSESSINQTFGMQSTHLERIIMSVYMRCYWW